MEDSGLPLESNKSLTIESDLPLPGESSDLGLHLVHSPTLSPSVDIIFVHGLAGHSTLTWCKNRNPELFWPGKWLPLDIELAKARIFTYGYGGDWFAPRCQSQTVQSGFQSTAKNLLFQMRSGVDQDGWTFDIGSIPIVFVAFDIGGVVVKKAYTLGLADPRTSKMADRIAGMLFLATPHGTSTNLAGMLHRIFRAGGMMEPIPIIDMAPIAIVMQAIDIEFRKNATKLSVWSFYDMQTTNARLLRFPLLGGSTSVIRNPKDFSAVLDSDHTNLCKFGSCTEVNYLAVLSGLRAIVQRTVEGPDLIYKPLSFERIEVRIQASWR
jgi:hypothetical protein